VARFAALARVANPRQLTRAGRCAALRSLASQKSLAARRGDDELKLL
jgi:hypothetical protein